MLTTRGDIAANTKAEMRHETRLAPARPSRRSLRDERGVRSESPPPRRTPRAAAPRPTSAHDGAGHGHGFGTGRDRQLKRRVIRNGALVVGGSILASMLFTQLSFALVGDNDYAGSMLAAALIPLVVATPAYGWIATLTLRLERSNAALSGLAHTDALTGIPNRRAAMARLGDWLAGPGPARACSLAIVDVDDFKCINDRFGHETGDAALCHVATILEHLALPGWLIARIGGEEFLLAAPEAAGAGFAERIETLRRVLAATPLITPAGPHTITASFGMAERRGSEATAKLLARADRALYRAKETGRNRVERAA